MNWNLPTLTDLYTDFLTYLKDRDLDVAKGLDPAIVTVTNPVTNMIRWNSANSIWEKYNGSTWVALSSVYLVQVGAFTGDVTKPSGSSTLTVANGVVTYAKMQNVSATDRLLGRATAGAGVVEEITCTANARALLDDTTFANMRTTLDVPSNNEAARLGVEDQALTGGVIVTSKSLGTISSGTVTPDPGDRPQQHYTNNGAHTLAPSSNAGSILLDITNDASAGAITTSGFTKVAGDPFTTTNGHKFRCHISIGSAGSLLQVQALQ